MKAGNIRNGIILGLAMLSACSLFYISQSVQQVQDEKKLLKRQTEQEEDSLRILKAEWAYLNNPEYLEALSRDTLALHAPEADSLIPDMEAKAIPLKTETILHSISLPAGETP